ncbi:MAG: transketolase family protein [Sphaerochaetaceae bacterium]
MSTQKMMRTAYGEALVELGEKNNSVVVLDADLSHATMTNLFAKAYPSRFFNVGIAEANLIDMSVGMSRMGRIPFCSTFALFGAGRAYEEIRNSVAYPNSNVKICCTHGGVTVGEDGGSHQAIEDFALMRVIPGMTVVVPCDANEVRKAIFAVAEMEGPVYMRIGRSPSPVLNRDMPFVLGKANVLKEGTDLVLFACGIMVPTALDCAEALRTRGVDTAVVNIHTLKPMDRECVLQYAHKCKRVVTMEEHSTIGGLGDAVASVLIGNGDFQFLRIGVQDRFGQSGTPEQLLEEYGLSFPKALQQITTAFKM